MVNRSLIAIIGFLNFFFTAIHCRNHHVVDFRWPDLFPASFIWDPKSDHFVVGSTRHRQLISVSDAGVVSSLLSNESLPSDSSFRGLSLHPRRNRLYAVVRRESPPYSALAVYELPSFNIQFFVPLDDLLPSTVMANDVAVDFSGNAYVTDANNDVVFKITEQGEATILSRSKVFNSFKSGIHGVVYNQKGYLLVTKSSSGKVFKVNADDGSTRVVILNKELTGAEGISSRRDGVVLVVSHNKLYFIKSDDSWSQGAVVDETLLDGERQATAVTTGAENRAYILYGYLDEGNSEREEFKIAEVFSEIENEKDNIWIFVVIGLGLAYFTFWRFQMKRLAQNMSKKTS